jgi:hypothetical protein
MGKPRTIAELVQELPGEAQRAPIYRGRTLWQLLDKGEVSCLTKLTNVACSSGDSKAAHWSLARKVHFALVSGGLDEKNTGITPKRFTLRSASPGARAKRARQLGDKDVGDASQATLDRLFRRDSGEDASDAEADAGDDGEGASGGDDAEGKAGEPEEGAGSDGDGGGSGSEKGDTAQREGDNEPALSSESEAEPIRRRVTMKVRSPLKSQVQSRLRAAAAVAAKESADRARREATWLSSIKELTSQVSGLSRYVVQQGETLRSSELGLAQLASKMEAVERQTAAAAAEAPGKFAAIFDKRLEAVWAAADKEAAAKAAVGKAAIAKVTAERAVASVTAAKEAANKAAAEKEAADKTAAEKGAADKAAAEKDAADKVAGNQAPAEPSAIEKSAAVPNVGTDAGSSGAKGVSTAGHDKASASGKASALTESAAALAVPGNETQVCWSFAFVWGVSLSLLLGGWRQLTLHLWFILAPMYPSIG